MEIIQREGIYIWYYFSRQFSQIFGYWVAGMLIGSAVSVFFKDKIHGLVRNIGDGAGDVFGIVVAAVLGILSPLCMYGTVPIAASFSRGGMKDGWLAAFMMSSILLNPQLVIYSAALGGAALAVRIVSCFLCGIAAGVVVLCLFRGGSFFDFTGFDEPKNRDTDPNPVVRYVKNLGRNIRATGLYFLAGVFLSALFQRYIPQEWMTALFGGSEAWGVLMASTIGVPLYVCGGGTIPILQAWLADGMSMGSAAAFMITGPATKITNLGALKAVLGAKHFLFYWLFVILFSCIAGLAVNAVL
ncbi:MAG: permease [Lachnospiraceae bacterium]|nr:permease [Lachnospiraceae bacterium]